MDGGLNVVEKPDQWKADAGSDAHQRGAAASWWPRPANLPVGAVVLLSDGAENSGGIDLETINALHNRRLPVHTIGFGKEKAAHDVEMDEVAVAAKAMAGSRMTATVSFHQHGYAGQKATLEVKDGDKLLATKEVTLEPDGVGSERDDVFQRGRCGSEEHRVRAGAAAGRGEYGEQRGNSAGGGQRGAAADLYVEGEPRWEFKFIRRAEAEDKGVQIVSMLRTTENKIYRQGITDPSELADGFPTKAEDLFKYQAIIIGSVEAEYFTPVQQELAARVCGQARRRAAVPGREVLAERWWVGLVEPGGPVSDLSAGREGDV